MSYRETPLHLPSAHLDPHEEVIPVEIGMPTDLLDRCHAPQLGFQWCWAAVAQTVLAVNEIDIDQASIVEETFGRCPNGALPDSPATLQQLTETLNRTAQSRDLTPRVVMSDLHVGVDFNLIREELCWFKPVILAFGGNGAIGHAVLCTGILYNNHNATMQAVIVRDPSPRVGARGRRALTRQECERIIAMWTVRAQHWPETF